MLFLSAASRQPSPLNIDNNAIVEKVYTLYIVYIAALPQNCDLFNVHNYRSDFFFSRFLSTT